MRPSLRRGRRRSSTGRSSGRRPSSAAGASRSARRAARSVRVGPAEPRATLVRRSDATSTSVKSRVTAPDPGRAAAVGGLAVELEPPGRLDVSQPQPGGGAQDRSSVSSCSAKPKSSLPDARARPNQSPRSAANPAKTSGRRCRPPSARCSRRSVRPADQRQRRPRPGPRLGGGLRRAPHDVGRWSSASADAGHDADAVPLGCRATAIDRERARLRMTPLVVSVLPAHRRLAVRVARRRARRSRRHSTEHCASARLDDLVRAHRAALRRRC